MFNARNPFATADADNMLGSMLGRSMQVIGMDPFGDSVRQARMLTPEQKLAEDKRARDEYNAKHLAGLNSSANQAWLASLKPEDRRIYSLMQRTL